MIENKSEVKTVKHVLFSELEIGATFEKSDAEFLKDIIFAKINETDAISINEAKARTLSLGNGVYVSRKVYNEKINNGDKEMNKSEHKEPTKQEVLKEEITTAFNLCKDLSLKISVLEEEFEIAKQKHLSLINKLHVQINLEENAKRANLDEVSPSKRINLAAEDLSIAQAALRNAENNYSEALKAMDNVSELSEKINAPSSPERKVSFDFSGTNEKIKSVIPDALLAAIKEQTGLDIKKEDIKFVGTYDGVEEAMEAMAKHCDVNRGKSFNISLRSPYGKPSSRQQMFADHLSLKVKPLADGLHVKEECSTNGGDRTEVKLKLDESDPNPQKTIENVQRAILVGRGYTKSLFTVDEDMLQKKPPTRKEISKLVRDKAALETCVKFKKCKECEFVDKCTTEYPNKLSISLEHTARLVRSAMSPYASVAVKYHISRMINIVLKHITVEDNIKLVKLNANYDIDSGTFIKKE